MSSFENIIHLLLQCLAILGWAILSIKIWTKKDYVRNAFEQRKKLSVLFYYSFLFSSISVGCSLLFELTSNNYDLTWNLWYWYPTNYSLIFVGFCFLKLLERLMDYKRITERYYFKEEYK